MTEVAIRKKIFFQGSFQMEYLNILIITKEGLLLRPVVRLLFQCKALWRNVLTYKSFFPVSNADDPKRGNLRNGWTFQSLINA